MLISTLKNANEVVQTEFNENICQNMMVLVKHFNEEYNDIKNFINRDTQNSHENL